MVANSLCRLLIDSESKTAEAECMRGDMLTCHNYPITLNVTKLASLYLGNTLNNQPGCVENLQVCKPMWEQN